MLNYGLLNLEVVLRTLKVIHVVRMQNRNGMRVSETFLVRFKQNKLSFKRRIVSFITVDETWINHYSLERKEQLKQ